MIGRTFVAALLAASATGAGDWSGPAVALDAATLQIGGSVVRLYGILVPDLNSECQVDEQTLPCGQIARDALMDLVAGATVECAPRGSSGSALLAICAVNGFDLGESLIYAGWARAAVPDYADEEEQARSGHHGLWRWTENWPLP